MLTLVSEVLTTHAALARHHALLGLSDNHHGGDLSLGAALNAGLLSAGELVFLECVDAVTEAELDHVELHAHLSLHFEFLHVHLCWRILFNNYFR